MFVFCFFFLFRRRRFSNFGLNAQESIVLSFLSSFPLTLKVQKSRRREIYSRRLVRRGGGEARQATKKGTEIQARQKKATRSNNVFLLLIIVFFYKLKNLFILFLVKRCLKINCHYYGFKNYFVLVCLPPIHSSFSYRRPLPLFLLPHPTPA